MLLDRGVSDGPTIGSLLRHYTTPPKVQLGEGRNALHFALGCWIESLLLESHFPKDGESLSRVFLGGGHIPIAFVVECDYNRKERIIM
jgi:hypothetical protein